MRSLVRKSLAANASAKGSDVLRAKSALRQLGHYQMPDWGLSKFPDRALFSGIESFQKSQGLTVDGILKPGGETEAALLSTLTVGETARSPFMKATVPVGFRNATKKEPGDVARANAQSRSIAEKHQNAKHTHHVGMSGMLNHGLLGDLEDAYVNATAWHFENRDRLNAPLPKNEKKAIEMGFEQYPNWQSVEHQNNQGRPELKYGHPDGREVVFDGDTGEITDQNRIKGTYNYVTPPAMTDKRHNLKGMIDFLSAFPGHALLENAPFILAGNKRGDG